MNNVHRLETLCLKIKKIKDLSWAQKLELGYIVSILKDVMGREACSWDATILDSVIARLVNLQKEIGV